MDRINSFEERKNKHHMLVAILSRALPARLTLSLLLVFAVVLSAIVPPALATRSTRAKRPAKSATATTSQAGSSIVFYGPHYFIRAEGSPETVTEEFSIPSGIVAPYTIEIQNGADGYRRVSSASIQLNGVELFTHNEIDADTPVVSQTVTLQSSNVLAVTITSSIGSFLMVTVSGIQTVFPAASLVSIDPTRSTQGQTTLTVSLQGQNTHWVQGQTRASFGPEIRVNGTSEGDLGVITVTSPTTATAQLWISGTASLSPRTVKVVTTDVPAPEPLNSLEESASLTDGFTVVATSPPGASTTTVTTIAGLAGNPGFADGVASQARFQNPAGLAVGADDSIYIADGGNNRIRRLRSELDQAGNPQWVVSTLAGNGTFGFADGPAATTQFANPQGVAVDAAGVVFVADTANHRIRKIATDGTVSTFAGDGTPGFVDGAGNQARFNSPRGVAVDQQGNVYVADTGNAAVRLIDSSGQVSTLAGDGTIAATDSPARFDGPAAVTVDRSTAYVYLVDKGNHRIRLIDSTGTVTTFAGTDRGFVDDFAVRTRFAEPSGIAIDASGNLVVTDGVNSLVRQFARRPAGRGWALGVSTLAGSGERGSADGAGSEAGFLMPHGIVSTLSSAIIVADTGNHTLRRLTFPPVISSFSPASARAAETITIEGAFFDGRGVERNTVKFTRSPEAGGGQVVATVSAATQTSLTVVVPNDAVTGPVTVQTEGGTAVSPGSFEVIPPPPVITDFSPQAGPLGTTVTLNGTALKAPDGDPLVTFTGRGNTRLPALVTFASQTQVQAIVPNAAVTGHIELTTAGGQANTTQDFTVTASQDFQITVAPASASAVQGTAATYVVQVTSAHPTFTQLARLTATGLPSGVSATFDPSQITAGASSTLTLNLANANLAAGAYSFNINAAADIDGNEAVRTAAANLTVVASGQTSLSGRVLSTDKEPIIGATISLDGHSATTDAAGAFLLTGIDAGPNRPVMIDGRTASAPNRTYPVLNEPATIVAGQANAVPYVFYLPPIAIENDVIIAPAQTTVVTTPSVPGLQLTVPAGANLRNRDNTPVTRVSITPVPIDRTPTPLPSNVNTAMVYTNQPGGAISDTPMPMVFPNLSGANPGTRADLYAFNHDTVQWYVYGYGRVSADGRLIEPEINPATGQPYGLVDFSWYFPSVTPDGNPGDSCPCPSNRTNDPVDLSTGTKIETATDISFGGARGGISLTRVFTSDLNATGLSAEAVIGRFGRGTKDGYDVELSGSFGQGGAGRIIFPEERSGRLFSYVSTDPDGSFVFASTGTISHLGNSIRQLTDGTFEFRSAKGSVLRFNSDRRLVAMIDRNGNTTTLNYSGTQLTSVTDPVGRSITFAYNSLGLIDHVTDPIQRVWHYSYSESPFGYQLSTVTNPLDEVVRYTYTEGPLTQITDGRGNMLKELSYNSDGRVSEQRFADGGFERYTYQTSGRVVTAASVTDSLGRTESKRFNAAGYIIGMTDALGQTSIINRDITTNTKTSSFGSCGCAESTNEFDERGNLTASTDRLGQTAHWEYEPVFNEITRATDRMGRVTNYGYDSLGNLTSITNALNETITLTYDGFGQLTGIQDPLNHTTTLEYDAQGNLTGLVDALNNRATFEYDGIGRITAAIDPLNRRRSVTYDAMGRTETTTDANNATTHYTHDANGNLTSLTNALQQTWQWGYDERNRNVAKIDPLGRPVELQYNTAGELTELKSPANRITHYDYDARGQLSTITDALNNVIHLSYDDRGSLTMLADQRGNTTTYTYDELARLVGKRNPLGQFTELVYDPANKVTAFIDPLGRRTTINYDELHRPTTLNFPDATVTYTYDAAGRVTQVGDSQSAGNIDFSYDDANRLLSQTTTTGVVSYEYNAANQRTSMTAANAAPVNYSYDTAGRLQSITQGSEVFTYAYDTLSRLASLARPNGITRTFDYDGASRLQRMTDANAINQTIEDYRFTYTLDDQISSITSVGLPTAIPGARSAGPANAANRIDQFASANYTFDALGQTTSKTDSQGTTNYQWDARGRLTSAALPNGQTVSYGYDAFGRRTSRTTGGSTTSFLYDVLDVVRDSGDAGDVEYLNGPGLDNKLRQSSTSTGNLYFLQDHLGSTNALMNASGAVVEQSQYEGFGESTGSSLTRYGYTGRERDAETGLLYYRARWYDPQQGRFLSEDPIGFAGGANFYAYSGNSPVNAVDPLGLYTGVDDAVAGLIGGLVGLGGQAFGDLLQGRVSGWEDYVGSFVGGAAGGVALLYTGPIGAGAVGGFTTDLTKQLLKYLNGKQCGIDLTNLAVNTGIGAATGLIPGVGMEGVTAGRGSYNAIYKQMVTKLENGTIDRVSVNTAGKMVAGRMVDTATVPGAGAAAAAGVGASHLFDPSETAAPCRGWH